MAKPLPPKTTINASCLCNSINFSGVDKKAVLCHCSNCKKFGGGAFMHNHRFLDAAVSYQSGEDSVKVYEDTATKTGNTLMRHFCSRCGTSLYMTNPKPFPGLVIVCGSTFGDISQPSFELFAEEKHPWIGETTPPKKPARM
ncbi:glutathione-dependent formaldehyde-activating enzyme family protein [Teratosphaeria destructans]|uniref:Glutathione-dependent formaldehyde-activating enzyme family protein n=1 Tax=Teratosphaeria destructans TaxID=418781 RepID=A0A9W7SK66_9PEZI|nr:glutathione-dependent formaldehyde-activating enzyme family protein [Teratosphaeria destructans]